MRALRRQRQVWFALVAGAVVLMLAACGNAPAAVPAEHSAHVLDARGSGGHRDMAWYYSTGTGTFGSTPTALGQLTLHPTNSGVVVATASAVVGDQGGGGIVMTCGLSANTGTGWVPVGNPAQNSFGGTIGLTVAIPVPAGVRTVSVALNCSEPDAGFTLPYTNVDMVAWLQK